MFKDYRDFFKKIIKSTTNVDISEYELYNNEINSGNTARDYRLDILLKKDNDFIIIEMNKNADKRTLLKARKYLYAIAGGGLVEGEDFKKMRTILINFNNSKYKNDKEAISVGYDLINSASFFIEFSKSSFCINFLHVLVYLLHTCMKQILESEVN